MFVVKIFILVNNSVYHVPFPSLPQVSDVKFMNYKTGFPDLVKTVLNSLLSLVYIFACTAFLWHPVLTRQ